MRIGLFTDTYPPEINGVANSTYILYKELTRLGNDVYVITTNSEGGISSHWEDEGHTLRFKGIEMRFLYGYVAAQPFHFTALKEIENLNLDIIHAQTEFGVGIFAHICASKLDIPLVSTYHTTYEDYTHYVNFINSKHVDDYAKKAVAYLSRVYGDSSVSVIAPSEKTKELLQKYRIRKDIDVIPTGLELDLFNPVYTDTVRTHEIRSQYGIEDDAILLISLGRLAAEKSVDVVINAVKQTIENETDVRLMIVGGGPDFDKTKELISSYGLDNKIVMTGPVPKEQVPDYYRASDMFVSASLSETQGMTFIEALASGIPLLVRYDRVLEGLVDSGKTGWYFENSDEFEKTVKEFIAKNTEERRTMAKACCEQVQPYNSRIFGEKVQGVYDRAIEKYRDHATIEDVKVKDSFVQLYIVTESKEELRLMVTLDDYAEIGLRKGGPISRNVMEHLKEKEKGVLAYQGCLRRIAIKDRTRKEIYDWLTKETECDIETINKIVDKLEEKGYINDERYTTEAISSMKATLQGPRRIRNSLEKKGIPVELYEKQINETDSSYEEEALAYGEKVMNRSSSDSVRKEKDTVRAKLMQRGFENDTVEAVMQKLDFTEAEDNELENLRKCAQKARKRYERKYSSSMLRNHVFRYCMAQGFKTEDIYGILDEMEWEDE